MVGFEEERIAISSSLSAGFLVPSTTKKIVKSGTAVVSTNRHPDGPNSSGHWELELSVLRVFRHKARAVPDLEGIRVMSGQ
jgi:hypothetical protein